VEADARDTFFRYTVAPGAGAQQQEEQQEQENDTVVPQGPGTRQHRAQLRTHVTDDTNTEHDFPVGGIHKGLDPPTSDLHTLRRQQMRGRRK